MYHSKIFHVVENKAGSLFDDLLDLLRQLQECVIWFWKGKPESRFPHLYKQKVVKDYIKLFQPQVFLETGTYMGYMVNSVLNKFSTIYSIELDHVLASQAKRRFSKYKHISILEGDSAKVLPDLLEQINSPCLFWLDAHYSGGITAKAEIETPVMMELRLILSHPMAPSHVILIDDARCFNGTGDYPTISEIDDMVTNLCPLMNIIVDSDIIRINATVKK